MTAPPSWPSSWRLPHRVTVAAPQPLWYLPEEILGISLYWWSTRRLHPRSSPDRSPGSSAVIPGGTVDATRRRRQWTLSPT